jgi:hypothetical protein
MTRRMTLAFLALYLNIPIMVAAAENLRLNPAAGLFERQPGRPPHYWRPP